jgi:molecular chaperone Hsp33
VIQRAIIFAKCPKYPDHVCCDPHCISLAKIMKETGNDPNHDAITRFSLADNGIRGVLVRLDSSWQELLSHADYPAPVIACLGETCAAAAGAIRGIARHQLPLPDTLTPRDFGTGSMLAITIEQNVTAQAEAVRYQGLVELDAGSLAESFERYFAQSEQLPTRILLSANNGCAAGLMLQRLPGTVANDDAWHRATLLFETLRSDELRDTPVSTLLYRLFHEDGVRILDTRPLRFQCSCSRERVAAVLVNLGETEAMASAQEDGVAEITCEFCNRQYRFDRVDLAQLFTTDTVPSPSRQQ